MTDAYRAIPPQAWQNDWFELMPQRPTEVVHERDRAPQPTGLLDQHGVPLYRVPTRHPLGFDLSGPRAAATSITRAE